MEINVDDSTFEEEVIERSKDIPVLVDFWASWCGPCRILGPTLSKIAEEYDGQVVVARLSVEENNDAPSRYAVMSIPAVKLFKDGKVVDEFVGARPERAVREFLDKNL